MLGLINLTPSRPKQTTFMPVCNCPLCPFMGWIHVASRLSSFTLWDVFEVMHVLDYVVVKKKTTE